MDSAQAWVAGGGVLVELRIEVIELGAEELVTSGEATQGTQAGGVVEVFDLVGAGAGQLVDKLVAAQFTVFVAESGAGVDQDTVDLTPAGLKGLVRAAAGDHQRP